MARLRGESGTVDWSPVQQDDSHDASPTRPANDPKEGTPLTSAKPYTAGSSVIQTPGKYNRGWSVLATDAAAILLPLATLALVVGVYLLNGAEVDKTTIGYWRNAIIVFASVFPIAFAAIIGRLTYQISRYKLEQGVTIGFLEQMIGSRTFGGAILSQISLGTINVVGIGLVLLWACSPLGTQSMLRVLEVRPLANTVASHIAYRDSTADTRLVGSYRFMNGPGQDRATKFWQTLSATMKSLVLLPEDIQVDTMDMWGNVKIPFLDDGFGNKTVRNTEWQDVVWSPERENFSALAGIPVDNVPVGNTTFSLESTYIALDCYNMTALNASNGYKAPMSWNWTGIEEWELGDIALDPGSFANDSWQGSPPKNHANMPEAKYTPFWNLAIDRFVDIMWMNDTWLMERSGYDTWEYYDMSPEIADLVNSFSSPRLFVNETGIQHGRTRLFSHFYFNLKRYVEGDSVTAYCDVQQKYVENRVVCERAAGLRQNCTVIQQRPSRKPHSPESISYLNFPDIFMAVSAELTRTTDMGGGHDISYNYMVNPLRINDADPVIHNLDPGDFSRRLSQLINTFMLVGSFDFGSTDIYGNDRSLLVPNVTAEADFVWYTEVYHVPMVWAVLSLVAGIVFLLGGIASIVFTHLSHGPEVLGFASTVVRDSKFMDLPPGAHAMSAIDLSKEIKHRRVRYGYSDLTERGRPLTGVGPVEEMAHIAGR